MKKNVLRLTVLSVALISMFLLETDTKANSGSCSELLFQSHMSCDNEFFTTMYNFNTRFSQCHQEASITCGSSSGSCYNQQYENCYNPRVISYNNRNDTYGDCLQNANQDWYQCYEELDFCRNARDRANQCMSIYNPNDPELNLAYMNCYFESQIHFCE